MFVFGVLYSFKYVSFSSKLYVIRVAVFTAILPLICPGGDEKGSLKSETVKCGRESQGTWTQERLR
jgi:hypothetical protein